MEIEREGVIDKTRYRMERKRQCGRDILGRLVDDSRSISVVVPVEALKRPDDQVFPTASLDAYKRSTNTRLDSTGTVMRRL